jgi:outer membrane protein assembly factor BamA
MNDYFIPKMRYTYTYNSTRNKPSPIRWELTLEEAGNVTALYDVLIQGYGWNEKEKPLFKNPYSQYVKIETDLTKTWPIDSKSQLVGHINAGVMWSYGNATDAPFSERFYAGGANSIRAFTVRTIGPGSYPTISNNVAGRQLSYLLQNGDSKLIMNLEYRRQLLGNLYGAIFLDAGNVWSTGDYTINPDDLGDLDDDDREVINIWNREVSDLSFKPGKLLKHLATGTGLGLRYDMDFLVIRVDWGFGLHVPYTTDKSGYFNIPRFKDMHSLHLAIGYPF